MAQQTFFHETSHANYGVLFDHDMHTDDAEQMYADIKERVAQISCEANSIYKVIAQLSSGGQGVQIFVAPHLRYVELAELVLDEFKYNYKVYITDKKLVKRQIRKKDFVDPLRKILRNYDDNRSFAIKQTVELIKTYYESESKRLDKEIEKIGAEFNMGKVRYQEYYAGLAHTWLEYENEKGLAPTG